MLVGIIAMIGSFLVGTLGKDYLISVNAQMYGWTPTYSYSITDSDFQDSIKMEEFFYKIREIDDCVTITFDMRENIRFAPIISVSSLQGAANDIYKKSCLSMWCLLQRHITKFIICLCHREVGFLIRKQKNPFVWL